jgi:hypothetical protein
MNRKLVGIILVIIGLIALVGAGIFIYVILEFNTAIGMLSTADPAIISQFGVGAEQIGTIVSTIQTILAIGSIWLIIVIVTALYTIYSGINLIKKRK